MIDVLFFYHLPLFILVCISKKRYFTFPMERIAYRLLHDRKYIASCLYYLLSHKCMEFHCWKSDNWQHSFLIDLQILSLHTIQVRQFLYPRFYGGTSSR